MQIPLKWINELIEIESITLDDLIEKLTLGGFEVEEILEIELDNQKELVLDISATANRSDSLSIQGIAIEMATLLNKSNKISDYSRNAANWKKKLENLSTVHLPDSECSTFITLLVENVTNTTVPKWIKQKLISSGLSVTDSLLDFQNYILLETGYPFAFYDLNKICSKLNCSDFDLFLSKANHNEKFFASNAIDYQLNSSTRIVKANDFTISIAGIIERKDFQYTDSTTSFLIEGSIFNAALIRQQSRALGLRTDRSARYEKSLKNVYLIESFYRLISLLRIYNPNLTCKLHTMAQYIEEPMEPIQLRYKTITEILGPISNPNQKNLSNILPETISNYLNRLNFEYSYDNENLIWKINVPNSRVDDIRREIDVIEEIGRLHGFNNFVTTLPKIKNIGNEDVTYQTRKKITSCLLNMGLNELIHYSLVKKKTFRQNDIELINPLLSDCSMLRLSLLPDLIETIQENIKQANLFIEGFEYGHVFSGNVTTNLIEKEYIAGIFGGVKTKLTWSDSENALTWFEAKGKIEQLLKQLNLTVFWGSFFDENEKIFHPYRSSNLYLENNQKLGIFGQIHPLLANEIGLSPDIYLFELDVELIQKQIQTNKLTVYKEYSLYPKITKDISFIVDQDILINQINQMIYLNGTKFLSEINLLDEYTGKSIPDRHKSLCLELVFQSKDQTLETKKIDEIIKRIQLLLTNKFDILIRN
jgi:phenylalanyl-tRNA synthetase beta chain